MSKRLGSPFAAHPVYTLKSREKTLRSKLDQLYLFFATVCIHAVKVDIRVDKPMPLKATRLRSYEQC